ncbi:hypothetical protein [Fodinicurvata sp. EGI_FJ10296]|uniref:hypothetical protein n=1 Tax=Fodinicurvata sp. EGI_FJ10296 TaxID=3231908 RepID=UPI0034514549
MDGDDDKKDGPARKSGSKTGAAKGKKGRNVNQSLRSFIPEEPPMPKAAPSAEDYNRVVKSARLARIFMTGSEFKSEPAYFNHGDSGSFDHNLDHELTVIDNDTDAGRIAAILQWKVFVTERATKGSEKSKSESDASPVLSIEARYLIAYDQIEDGSEDAMKHFMEKVGKMATYPYFRAHVSHINGEAEASLPLLPILR